ncbi:MAG TPA: hypothetical protein VIM14_11180, partial [Polyangia bacterium]
MLPIWGNVLVQEQPLTRDWQFSWEGLVSDFPELSLALSPVFPSRADRPDASDASALLGDWSVRLLLLQPNKMTAANARDSPHRRGLFAICE